MTTDRRANRDARRQRRRASLATWTRCAISIGLVTGIYFLAPMTAADLKDTRLIGRGIGLLVGMGALTWVVGRQVRRALESNRRLAERIAILATLLDIVVVFFAALYVSLADQFTGLSTRLDGLYFAVTTLSTVGYGDIAATGQAARALVVVQMFFDLIIVTSATSIVVTALRSPVDEPPVPP